MTEQLTNGDSIFPQSSFLKLILQQEDHYHPLAAADLVSAFLIMHLSLDKPQDKPQDPPRHWCQGAFKTPLSDQLPSALNLQRDLPGPERVGDAKLTMQDLKDLIPFGLILPKKIPAQMKLYQVINQFSLRQVPLMIQRTLVAWYHQLYQLHLIYTIPSSLEMLQAQAKGERYISLLIHRPDWQQPILGKKNVLDFLLHDLSHADRFFYHPQLYLGQKGFFKQLHKIIQQNFFRPFLQNDAQFKAELDYILADMNSFCGHLFLQLKATLIGHFVRAAGLPPQGQLPQNQQKEFERIYFQLLNDMGMDEKTQLAAQRLNTKDFDSDRDLRIIESFFINSAT